MAPRAGGTSCLNHPKRTASSNNLYFNRIGSRIRDVKNDNKDLRLKFSFSASLESSMLGEDHDNNPYLQQEVLTASPVRLRWMLIIRAKELCDGVDSLWRDGQMALGDQWSLRIRDILGELLSGVTEGNPASPRVADFYLYLLKVLSEAEQSRDLQCLATLKDLLAYEAETWQLLLQKPAAEDSHQLTPHLPAPISSGYSDSDDFSSGSTFSLDV